MNEILHQVILHILRPLVRILHRKGIAFGEFSQLARKVYVEVAEHELELAGEKATTSRIAITTGLTRKDVARLRQNDAEEVVMAARYNRGVKVISGWINDVQFQNQDGSPASLVLQNPQKGAASFEQLVSRYSGDIPYRAMLKELQQGQVVGLDEQGHVILLADAYIPHNDEQEQLSILGQDVSLLISTIEHNLQSGPDDLYFQRKVRYDNLPVEALKEFKKIAGRKSMDLLLELNDWLAEHDRDSNPAVSGHGKMSAGIGVYYFEEADPGADPQGKGKKEAGNES
ncbi:MAG: DUF6502 family protein [Thiolinea sp.]